MADLVVICHDCKTPNDFRERVPFRAECEKCSADLHACLTCRFYDRDSENECRETEAEPVQTKDRSNLCEYFKVRETGASGTPEDDEVVSPAFTATTAANAQTT